MSSTVTPAYRPTASSIWHSFRTSHKRHLFLTGGRGTGKSTLLHSLFPHVLPGITTHAQPMKAVFMRENLSEATAVIGLYDAVLPGRENKMRPCSEGFSKLGVPALQRLMEVDSEWVSIDEIGYLETTDQAYCQALLALMDKKRLIAVIRKQDLPFLQQLVHRDDAFVLDLDAPFGNGACVIMASGLGKRFGGNKLMIPFQGQPLISHVLIATEDLFQSRVVVTRHNEVAALCREHGVPVILHALPNRSDTIRLGLEAVKSADFCAFFPGDQPLLRKESAASLALCAAVDLSSIWRTSCQGAAGLPVFFPQWAFSELLTLPAGKGGSYLISQHSDKVRFLNIQDPYELMDVDTPEDLQVLINHCR